MASEDDRFATLADLAWRTSLTGPGGRPLDAETREQVAPLRQDHNQFVRAYAALTRDAAAAPRLAAGDEVHLSLDAARAAAQEAGTGRIVYADVHAQWVILDHQAGRLTYEGGTLPGLRAYGEGERLPARPPWTVGDVDARWEAYATRHADGTTVMTNLLGIRDPERLREVEYALVENRASTLHEVGLPITYDLAGLQSVHRHLFQDVYPWAGELRTVGISKGESTFAGAGLIATAMEPVGDLTRETDLLRASAPEMYPDVLGMMYAMVNYAHPFREGNGRTNRAFIDALAAEAGYRLDWTPVLGWRNDLACARFVTEQDHGPIREMFHAIVQRAPESIAVQAPTKEGPAGTLAERLEAVRARREATPAPRSDAPPRPSRERGPKR